MYDDAISITKKIELTEFDSNRWMSLLWTSLIISNDEE